MIEQSILLNKIFHFSMRWQQLFSYLRNPTVKVVFKALEPVQLRIFTGCDFVCVPPFFSFFVSLSFSLSLSTSLSFSPSSFFTGQVQPWVTFFIRLKSFCSERAYLLCWSQQTDLSIHWDSLGWMWRQWKHKWTCILQDRISSFLWYAFIFLKRNFRGLNRAITDTIRMQLIFCTTGLI